MAGFTGSVYSEALKLRTNVELAFPQDEIGNGGTPQKMIIFLHGLTDNYGAYSRWTNLAWLVRKYNFVAVMPDAGRSWYFNMREGLQYFTFLTEELCPLLEKMFTLPKERFLVGNSMGGYGAMKAFLRCPDRFAGVAALSGAFNVKRVIQKHPELQGEFKAILGSEALLPSGDDVYALAEQAEPDARKALIACGMEDEFIQDSKRLEAVFRQRGLPHRALYGEGGHDWEFWNRHLEAAISYLLLDESEIKERRTYAAGS